MTDEQIDRWAAKLQRAVIWRDRMWLSFALSWGAFIVMIFVAHEVKLSTEFLVATFLSLFALTLASLIAAIAFTFNARVARQQIAHLEKQQAPSAGG